MEQGGEWDIYVEENEEVIRMRRRMGAGGRE
jgi:hypothetical protein